MVWYNGNKNINIYNKREKSTRDTNMRGSIKRYNYKCNIVLIQISDFL